MTTLEKIASDACVTLTAKIHNVSYTRDTSAENVNVTIEASHADVYVQNKPLELTLRQALLVSAYTGVLCCKFSTFHEFVESLLGRPVFTHELADPAVKEAIRLACKDDFLAICDPTL